MKRIFSSRLPRQHTANPTTKSSNDIRPDLLLSRAWNKRSAKDNHGQERQKIIKTRLGDEKGIAEGLEGEKGLGEGIGEGLGARKGIGDRGRDRGGTKKGIEDRKEMGGALGDRRGGVRPRSHVLFVRLRVLFSLVFDCFVRFCYE